MHSYLRAIGFSEFKSKKSIDSLLKEIIQNPDTQTVVKVDYGEKIIEVKKEFLDGMGITIHGSISEVGEIDLDYYFPYVIGDHPQVNEEITIEKHIAQNSYACFCDDLRLGVSLIFYLQNSMDYINTSYNKYPFKSRVPVTFAALSTSGKILLPVKKTEVEIKKNKVAIKNRNNLIAAARKGDEEAMESLTIEDLDMYTKISRRILKEDVFSIVDSSFMPFGIECDQYAVVGDIVDVNSFKNSKTDEEVYNLTINCNELLFNIGINKKDLFGLPEVGRRFKGTIWMQGNVEL